MKRLVAMSLLAIAAAAFVACGQSDEERVEEALAELGASFQEAFGPAFPPGNKEVDSSPSSSRKTPLSLGTTATLKEGGFEFEISITQILRGQAAWDEAFAGETSFVPSLDPGEELIIFLVRLDFVSGPEEESYDFDIGYWDVVSAQGEVYEAFDFLGGNPEPYFDFSSFPGSETERWVQFIILEADPAPVSVFGANGDLKGGAWLALTE